MFTLFSAHTPDGKNPLWNLIGYPGECAQELSAIGTLTAETCHLSNWLISGDGALFAGADPFKPEKPSAAKLESESVLLGAMIDLGDAEYMSRADVQHVLRTHGLQAQEVRAEH